MNYALYVGRFQPIHWGHVKVIQSMIKDGYNPIIVVGSSQEVKSEKNPLDITTRIELLTDLMAYIKPNKFHIIPLSDISVDADWVPYVLNNVKFITGHTPTVFYGGDEVALSLFKEAGMVSKKIDRVALEISATMVRDYIKKEDCQWKVYIPSPIHDKVYNAFFRE